jgi:hypothetical protein
LHPELYDFAPRGASDGSFNSRGLHRTRGLHPELYDFAPGGAWALSMRSLDLSPEDVVAVP